MAPAQQCVTGALSQLLSLQPLSPGKIGFAWRVAVGASLERATSITLAPDATLDVRSDDPHWGREVRRLTPVILRRLTEMLGEGVIARINVISERRNARGRA